MSTYNDVRGALQTHAATAPGFPSSIAYEGVTFTSTVGIPWARMTLMPTSGQSFSVDGDTRYLKGLFQVDLFSTSRGNPGTASVETSADNVMTVFKSGTHLVLNSTTVIIDYAQRGPVMTTEDWLQVPITVGWRSYPTA